MGGCVTSVSVCIVDNANWLDCVTANVVAQLPSQDPGSISPPPRQHFIGAFISGDNFTLKRAIASSLAFPAGTLWHSDFEDNVMGQRIV